MPKDISVLCVDDEPDLLELGKIFLERSGNLRIERVTSAREALSARGQGFDIVVSDYQMPEMDGISFLKALRERGINVPFILFTGRGREEVAMEALNNGADYYVQKGGDPESMYAELEHKIRLAVERKMVLDAKMANESRLRSMIENTAAGYFLVDLDGSFRDVNNAFLEMVVCSSVDDLMGLRIDKFIELGWGDDFHHNLKELLQRKKTIHPEARFRRADGSIGYGLLTANPFIESGRVAGLEGFIIDETDRKSTELALDRTKRRFEELFLSMEEGVALHELVRDADGRPVNYRLMDVNPSFERIIGMDRASVVGKLATEVYGTTEPPFLEEFSSVPISGINTTLDLYFRPLDKYFRVSVTTSQHDHFATIFSDVTPQRKAAEERERSLSLLNATLNSTADGIIAVDKDRRVQLSNRQFQGIWKELGEIVPGMDDRGLLDRSSDIVINNEEFRRRTESAYANPGEVSRDIVQFKDGRHFERYTMPQMVGEETLGRVWSYNDVTKRVENDIYVLQQMETIRSQNEEIQSQNEEIQSQNEELAHTYDLALEANRRLTESEERYKFTVEATSEGVIDWRTSEDDVYVSSRARTMLGYHPGSSHLKISDLLDRMHPDDRKQLMVQMKDHLEGRTENVRCEFRARRNDGKYQWVLVRFKVFSKDGEGKPTRAIGTTTDISERKLFDEALRTANRKLSLLNSITRHDILNQLLVLDGYLTLQDRMASDDRQKSNLNRMRHAIEAIQNQVEFTRDYDSLGTKEPEWQRADLLLQRAKDTAKTDGITFHVDLEGLEIFADPMLEKVFHNLVDNSRRHGEKVDEIKVSWSINGREAEITFEDNGVGIPAESRRRLFEKGFGKNTGLGLFLSREILSITGIRIDHADEDGKGAKFVLVVPDGAYRTRSG